MLNTQIGLRLRKGFNLGVPPLFNIPYKMRSAFSGVGLSLIVLATPASSLWAIRSIPHLKRARAEGVRADQAYKISESQYVFDHSEWTGAGSE